MPAYPAYPDLSVLLLAGGRGQRMAGQDKGLLPWRGKPLIAWVAEQVRPLTDDLLISCNRNNAQYAAHADRLVADPNPDYLGPLAGILTGLRAARHEQLLILPCDAPCIDRDLLDDLLALAGDKPVMVRQGDFWEPLFCIVPRVLLDDLERAWLEGVRSPQRWLQPLKPHALVCAVGDRRLANFNTPDWLEEENGQTGG
ncbi:MAG: molybdenum cofactor guanylyltransferase MobA [Gammaproteobacteria bacterium]|nr:molybdenum cofactor guanylyltransferase MobA [Gammaproteobacteria bacterium]MBU1490142.1 molybdenum cofactor guanylyltransferase MobA [Gammaproteobacteria bacterium]MBU2067913.1 molybdenum cofactor guanylyltransferase MobA [Gammaproteobacteria bacterium]MBU2140627.1 molybdenum cofactor guanylyltransferase MobA [Gammaproteobacteria bacterium]MBU2215281.1 molybdenum cofactor guanylyltransferase MobA [Gammaproteobacteria bacterium]